MFIEVVPQYPLPIPIYEKEDYYFWPVKMMTDKGYKSEIVTKRYGGQRTEEVINGILVKRFNNIISLFYYLYKNRNSLVYAQGKIFPAFTGLICKNSAYTPHGSFGMMLPKYFRFPLLRLITKFLWGNFARIIAITPYEMEIYKKFNFRNNYQHVYNAIDYSYFSKYKSSNKFQIKYKIKKNEQIILYVGNLHGNVKNIDVLYKAFKIIQKKVNNIRLVIIGRLIDLEAQSLLLKQLNTDISVTLTGWLPIKMIAQALGVAAVFVNTSKNEGHCLAVSEAAATGVPLCLSDIGTFKSVYKNNAMYHDSFDYKKLSENIIFYLNRKNIVLNHTRVNRWLIKSECDIPIVKDKLYKIFTEYEYKK